MNKLKPFICCACAMCKLYSVAESGNAYCRVYEIQVDGLGAPLSTCQGPYDCREHYERVKNQQAADNGITCIDCD